MPGRVSPIAPYRPSASGLKTRMWRKAMQAGSKNSGRACRTALRGHAQAGARHIPEQKTTLFGENPTTPVVKGASSADNSLTENQSNGQLGPMLDALCCSESDGDFVVRITERELFWT
jgi:hypothetical protein